MIPQRTNYFFDTEFLENGKTIELVSIGMVCEDGRELYLESREPKLWEANDWVKANVIPLLSYMEPNYDRSKLRWNNEIREEILAFTQVSDWPQFWAWYASYDWVVLCQLFGNMTDLPRTWNQFPMDLRAVVEWLGPQRWSLPKQMTGAHNALEDARHLKVMHDHVMTMLNPRWVGPR